MAAEGGGVDRRERVRPRREWRRLRRERWRPRRKRRAAQEDRMRAYVTASELQARANTGLLAKLDASEAAAAAATARAAETERERLENQLVLSHWGGSPEIPTI